MQWAMALEILFWRVPTVCLLLTLVRLSCSSGEDGNHTGILRLSILAQDAMEGSYVSLREEGLGIRFRSRLDSLSITTLSGNPLLKAEDSQGYELRLVSVAGWQFIQAEQGGTPSRDYAVPASLTLPVENSTPRRLQGLLGKITSDQSTDELALQVAITELLSLPETPLIIRAAFALGERGITGLDYPSSLPLYLSALQLQKLLVNNDKATQFDPFPGDHDRSRLRRESCLSECPPCPEIECLGLCGYGCSCWKFICGDCCYHLGCYEHDLCCRDTFVQAKCLFPFSFRCESNYNC